MRSVLAMPLIGLASLLFASLAFASHGIPSQQQLQLTHHDGNRTISSNLFVELEELSRIVDISYCVGLTGTGIQEPFQCLSRCSDFSSFELVKAWNTGPLMSDSCGYIAISHDPSPRRIILAFRGTYSVANTFADLSTIPQEYIPYPGDDDDESSEIERDAPRCEGCTVHTGFYSSWLNTRHEILATVQETVKENPDYKLTLVGHSLGGAIAALAGLDFLARGWDPVITTFGEPRIGNRALASYLDARFNLTDRTMEEQDDRKARFRRVTHVDDPVPLLPLEEWGYVMHGGEIYINKSSVPPENSDIFHCVGTDDHRCIAGGTLDDPEQTMEAEAGDRSAKLLDDTPLLPPNQDENFVVKELRKRWGIEDAVPPRYRLWQLFFAHRDYFWRLGLCVPQTGWWGDKPGND